MIDASLSALETSMGKIPDARMLSLGTRASSPDHPFERMLTGGADYAQVHAAQPDDDIFSRFGHGIRQILACVTCQI